jgi:hypothetical protein
MARKPKSVVAGEGIQCEAPAWGYRRGENGMESQIFEDGFLPPGWSDTPALDEEPAAEGAE